MDQFFLENVKHKIDDDACERDVDPNRPCVAGDGAVLVEVVFECVAEGDEDHREHDDGEDDVRNKNGKVKRARPIMLGIRSARVVEVVVEVTGEKEGGCRKGRDHAEAMGGDVSLANEDES